MEFIWQRIRLARMRSCGTTLSNAKKALLVCLLRRLVFVLCHGGCGVVTSKVLESGLPYPLLTSSRCTGVEGGMLIGCSGGPASSKFFSL